MVLPSPDVLCTHAAHQEHATWTAEYFAGKQNTCCKLLITYSSVSFCSGTESSPQYITCIRLVISSLDLALPRPAIGHNTRLHVVVIYYCSCQKCCCAKRVNRQTSVCPQQLAGSCVFIATTFYSKCQPWWRRPACSSSSQLPCFA